MSIPDNNLSIRVGEIAPHQFVGSYFDVPITFVGEKAGEVTFE
jgi:hypothetical protein